MDLVLRSFCLNIVLKDKTKLSHSDCNHVLFPHLTFFLLAANPNANPLPLFNLFLLSSSHPSYPQMALTSLLPYIFPILFPICFPSLDPPIHFSPFIHIAIPLPFTSSLRPHVFLDLFPLCPHLSSQHFGTSF